MAKAKREADWGQVGTICSAIFGSQGKEVAPDKFIPPDVRTRRAGGRWSSIGRHNFSRLGRLGGRKDQ